MRWLGRLVLPDYKPFIPVVAKAYLARPAYEPAAVPSWRALVAHVEQMFRQVQSRVRVVFTAHDPYEGNYAALREDVVRNRRLQIWTGESDHRVWTPEQNWKFRAVHDYMIHVAGDHGFTLRGEMSAYNRHARIAPPTARPALFTEIVGQVCTYFFLNRFPEQKIAFLYGFDYVDVGRVDERAYARNFALQAR
jgi:hypothetical protein